MRLSDWTSDVFSSDLPIPDVDMGLICQMAEEFGFQWVSYGHHTIRPLEEPVQPPHFGVPLYQDPLIGAARALALTKTLEVSTGVLIIDRKSTRLNSSH